jgi:cadmium resistance protein CadD (predicted permease)
MPFFLPFVLFIATNLDDLFLLMAFFSRKEYRAWQVVLGQFIGFSAILLISLVGAAVALIIPENLIQLLGIFPLGIGLYELYQSWYGKQDDDEDELPIQTPTASFHKVLSIAAITLANGGDNFGVYIPTFASLGWANTLLMCVVFLFMVAVWCILPYGLVNHRHWGKTIKRWGNGLLPFVLIVLGILILLGVW